MYGVAHKIECICADAYDILRSLTTRTKRKKEQLERVIELPAVTPESVSERTAIGDMEEDKYGYGYGYEYEFQKVEEQVEENAGGACEFVPDVILLAPPWVRHL